MTIKAYGPFVFHLIWFVIELSWLSLKCHGLSLNCYDLSWTFKVVNELSWFVIELLWFDTELSWFVIELSLFVIVSHWIVMVCHWIAVYLPIDKSAWTTKKIFWTEDDPSGEKCTRKGNINSCIFSLNFFTGNHLFLFSLHLIMWINLQNLISLFSVY